MPIRVIKRKEVEKIYSLVSDSRGPLHVKVYFPSLKQSEWYPEELVTFADALYEMEQVYKKPAARDMGEKPVEYFYPLVGTRHTDPEDGLQYEVMEIKVIRRKK